MGIFLSASTMGPLCLCSLQTPSVPRALCSCVTEEAFHLPYTVFFYHTHTHAHTIHCLTHFHTHTHSHTRCPDYFPHSFFFPSHTYQPLAIPTSPFPDVDHLVLWSIQYIQGCLCDLWMGTHFWILVESSVATELRAIAPSPS